MKKLSALLILIVLIGIAVFAASPYYTAYQLKQAYDNHQGDALVSHIDFTQLKPSVKQQLTQRLTHTLTQYPMVTKLGGEPLIQAANEFIDHSVEGAVTADNVSQLIATQGQANQATKELAAAWAIASNKVDLQRLIQDMIAQRGDVDAVVKNQIQIMMDKQSAELAQQAQSGEDSDKPELHYCGINCFTLSGVVKGYPVTVEMQREGLIDWKIIDVVLP